MSRNVLTERGRGRRRCLIEDQDLKGKTQRGVSNGCARRRQASSDNDERETKQTDSGCQWQLGKVSRALRSAHSDPGPRAFQSPTLQSVAWVYSTVHGSKWTCPKFIPTRLLSPIFHTSVPTSHQMTLSQAIPLHHPSARKVVD